MGLYQYARSQSGSGDIRAGVVGAGSVARTAHLPVYRDNHDVDLIAIADLDDESRISAAREYAANRTYDDGERMIRDESLDLISISTPPSTHRSLFVAAAEEGIHIYCEKPMATTVADAEAMAASAESAGIVTQIGYTRPYVENFKTVNSLVGNDVLGELKSLHTHRVRSPPSGRWNYNSEISGGGVIADQLPHIVDFYLRLFNDMPAIQEAKLRSTDIRDVEDFAEIEFNFGGIPVRTTLGWSLYTRHQRNVLVTDYGTLEYNMTDLTGTVQSVDLAQRYGENPVVDVRGVFRGFVAGDDNFHHKRVRDFINHVKANDRDTVAPADRGVEVTKIVRKVYDQAERDS